ncbi:MAG: hypothetical protein ACLRHW_08065 [Coprobacillus cateniformis]
MHEFIRIASHYLGCGEQQEVQKQRKEIWISNRIGNILLQAYE